MNEQHCDQCKNQCSIDTLRCNRGRVHFGMEPIEPKAPSGPIGLLQRCGAALHHGGIQSEGALDALSEQDQAELERLLTALLADWEKREGRVKRHHHGHH